MVDKAEDRLQIVCKPLKSDEAKQQNLYVSTIEAEIIAILYSEKAYSALIFECGALHLVSFAGSKLSFGGNKPLVAGGKLSFAGAKQ